MSRRSAQTGSPTSRMVGAGAAWWRSSFWPGSPRGSDQWWGREREGVEPSPDGADRRATGLKPARTTRPHPLPAYGSTPGRARSATGRGDGAFASESARCDCCAPASAKDERAGRWRVVSRRGAGLGMRNALAWLRVSSALLCGGAPAAARALAQALAPRSSRQGPWSRSGTGAAVSPIARNFL